MQRAIPFMVMALLFWGCGNSEEPVAEEQLEEVKELVVGKSGADSETLENNGIKLVPLVSKNEFSDAGISIDEDASEIDDMYIKRYRFTLNNFSLDDPSNSIIFIHNNREAQSLSRPSGKQGLLTAGNNVVLAYLYNALEGSIKTPGSFVIKNELFEGDDEFARSDAHMFYNFPRGMYEQMNGLQVPLDFFLLNTNLSDDGLRVRVTIDEATFELTSWNSYGIEGLGLGEHTVRIELLDKDGVNIFGPFTDSGTRTFFVLTKEQLQESLGAQPS